jgi:HK97 family phage portal protein
VRWPWQTKISSRDKILSDLIKNYNLKTDEDKILALLNYSLSASNISVTQNNALQVAAVFACVNVISGSLSMLPCQLFKKDGDNRREVGLTELPLAYMLRYEAFPKIPSQTILFSIIANLVLRGNGFAEFSVDGNQQPDSLTPLETALMSWDTNKNKWQYSPGDGSQRHIEHERLLHIRGFSFGGGVGLDMMKQAKEVISLALALDTNAAKFFANGSRLGTIFEADRALPPDVRADLEKRLKEKHEGPENSHRSLILESGLKAATNRSTNNDSQLDESRKHQIIEIARFFGVPPHKIGVDNNVPRANAEEANLGFITNTLQRYATLVEAAINVTLLGRRRILQGYYVKFNMGALLRGNMKDRFEAYNLARNGGYLCVDEIRAFEEWNPLPDGKGKIYLQPVNYVEAGTVVGETETTNTPTEADDDDQE